MARIRKMLLTTRYEANNALAVRHTCTSERCRAERQNGTTQKNKAARLTSTRVWKRIRSANDQVPGSRRPKAATTPEKPANATDTSASANSTSLCSKVLLVAEPPNG